MLEPELKKKEFFALKKIIGTVKSIVANFSNNTEAVCQKMLAETAFCTTKDIIIINKNNLKKHKKHILIYIVFSVYIFENAKYLAAPICFIKT